MVAFKLQVKNLGKAYGRNRVFNDISFSHNNGVLGIAGPNGSGKSTLVQCLAGLLRPTSGTIEWMQNDETLELQTIKKHIGYAAPYINLYPEMSCFENLDFLMQFRDNNNTSGEAINQALDLTEIDSLKDQLYGKLSTGQQQRLRLAAALVHQPDILMLDEPGSNLDEKGRHLIETIVSDAQKAGKMVILASNSEVELALCDRLYSVREEHIIEGQPD